LWKDTAGECDWWGTHSPDKLFFLAKSVSLIQELGLPFISISAPSIVSGMSGESEKTLRETFEEAKVRLSFAGVANPLNHK